MSKPAEIKLTKEHRDVVDLIRRVDTANPDQKTLAELEKALKEAPTLWRLAGDAAQLTQNMLIQDAGSSSALVRVSMAHGCQAIKEQLGYDGSPMLERLLIETVVLAWLRWSLTEYRYTNVVTESHTLSLGDYWERKLNAAQRRYLRALTTLARVRRMKLPPMQVNIGERQVNVAGG